MGDVARNIQVVEDLERAYAERDYEAVRAMIAKDLSAHTPSAEMLPAGVEGPIASNEASHASFSDRKTEILEIFGDGDRVVSHVRMTGTNDGGIPLLDVPANGKQVDFDWIQISRHAEDSTVLETWAQMDVPTLMVQLGVMPAPEGM